MTCCASSPSLLHFMQCCFDCCRARCQRGLRKEPQMGRMFASAFSATTLRRLVLSHVSAARTFMSLGLAMREALLGATLLLALRLQTVPAKTCTHYAAAWGGLQLSKCNSWSQSPHISSRHQKTPCHGDWSQIHISLGVPVTDTPSHPCGTSVVWCLSCCEFDVLPAS